MTAAEPDAELILPPSAAGGKSTGAKPAGLRRVGRGLRMFIRRSPMSAFWGVVAALVLLMAVAAPVLVPYDPLKSDFRSMTKPPTERHVFGTDQIGRDVLSRVIWGARASLLISLGSIVFGTLIGGLLGLIAGFKGGVTDTVLSAFFNIFLAFPQLVLALTLVSVLAPVKPSGGAVSGEWGHRIGVVILAIGIVSVPLLGRITRASAISWSQREFVMAARA